MNTANTTHQRPAGADDKARLQALADSLGCLTEDDLCNLYKVTPGTAEAWRKRGSGPEYILAGNAYLYPHDRVKADLAARVRTRSNSAKAVL